MSRIFSVSNADKHDLLLNGLASQWRDLNETTWALGCQFGIRLPLLLLVTSRPTASRPGWVRRPEGFELGLDFRGVGLEYALNGTLSSAQL